MRLCYRSAMSRSKSTDKFLIAEEMGAPSTVLRTTTRTLPGELLAMIPKRLRAVALVWALFNGLTLVAVFVLEQLPSFDGWPMSVYATFAAVFVISLCVALAASRFKDRPKVLLVIGLAYQVVGAPELVKALEQVQVPRPWSEERARNWWESNLPDVVG